MEEEKVEVSVGAHVHVVHMIAGCIHTSSEEWLYYVLLVLCHMVTLVI